MVNDTQINNTNLIIKETTGEQTGDIILHTADGRRWLEHKGEYIPTGRKLKTLWRPQ